MTSQTTARVETADEAFLGVEQSLSGKRWQHNRADDRDSLALAQRLEVPDAVARVLSARGLTLETAPSFLAPTLRDLLPDPSRLVDMDRAAERLATAIMQNEKIAIFGDYDVDGATSSALMRRFIEAVGGRTETYIPDRVREGYGPNAPALLELKRGGASVVVTVDCGSTAHAPLAVAEEAGLDVIVIDHHAAEAPLPKATAVVNPNRLDDDSGLGQLAAVGVAFLFIVAINRTLRGAGWYETRPEPDLAGWLDIVALGTVCDVVPLTGVNRAFVAQGLKVMAKRRNVGIRALADVAGVDEVPGTYHLGFILGPRVNAGGRVGAADLGARLLATENIDEAMDIARRLEGFNKERREIEDAVLQQVLESLEDAPPGAVAVAAGEGWHPGVIGIVASRIKEHYNRPACVVSLNGDVASGSGRSVPGVDLGAAVIAARQLGILEKGGGHPMAAGFTLARDRLPEFQAFLETRVAERVTEARLTPSLRIDGAVTTKGANLILINALACLEPFGQGNAEPRFVVANARVVFAAVAGSDHVRCTLESPEGGRLNGISFRSLSRPLGQTLLKADGRPMHVAGRLRSNTWQGRTTPQIMIDDAAPAW